MPASSTTSSANLDTSSWMTATEGGGDVSESCDSNNASPDAALQAFPISDNANRQLVLSFGTDIFN